MPRYSYAKADVEQVRHLYKNMPQPQRECLQEMLNEKRVTPFPYYSAIVIDAARVVTGAGFSYTVPRNEEFRAFSYAQKSGTAESAGFPVGYQATIADTNLAVASKTKDGDVVEIHGICAQIIPSYPTSEGDPAVVGNTRLTDTRWLGLLAGSVSIGFQLAGGDSMFPLGILGMLPGAGGLAGGGVDQIMIQQLAGGRRDMGFASNGEANVHNFFRLPLGHVWQDEGTDSLLQVVFMTQRQVIAYSGGDLDNLATTEAAAAGVRGYVYPTIIGAGIMCLLKGTTLKYRSENQ